MARYLTHVLDLFEYALAAILVVAAILLRTAKHPESASALVTLLGSHNATVVYAIWLILLAGCLLYAKWFKKKKLHKFTLIMIYFSSLFFTIFQWIAFGWSWFLFNQIVLVIMAAGCWLNWKLTTEYREMDASIKMD